jgi:hypothetical protein
MDLPTRAAISIKYIMLFLKWTDDELVQRLRWVMVGAILFSVINTLAGQPGSFWQHPETAMRGDGLSLHNPTNHTFEFFLGQSWQAYLLANLVYIPAAFFVVSILPRTAALLVIFSVIFGHFFGSANWLAVRWHLGLAAPGGYGFTLGAIIAAVIFPPGEPAADQIIKRLRWLMIAAILLDGTNTLIGQPGSYWHHPETVHEGNQFFRWFLMQGWWGYVLIEAFYGAGMLLLVSILPQTGALTCIFAVILGHFAGASNWFFYEWRMGMQAPVIYGVVLSAVIVGLGFSGRRKTNHAASIVSEPMSPLCSKFC